MQKTGAQILLECFRAEGVEHIFGFPGGAVLDIYDEIYKSEFPHIIVRHEQGAVHAADGYARASGKVGVCLVTSGPGATNTVTGIATAYMDSVPLIIITGQVPTKLIGNDAFQEADIIGITRPVTKHNYLINDVKDLAATMKEAFYLARSGRPGPILIDLPKDVIQAKARFSYPKQINLDSYKPVYKGHLGQISRMFAHMLKAKRPVFLIGGGVITSDATREIYDLAHRLQIPVTMSLMGLGAFPGKDPLSMGMLGMHGTYRANMAVTDCDVLFAIGVRFSDRVTGKIDSFAPHAEIIQVDIDPTSISKNVQVDIPIVGDAKQILHECIRMLDEKGSIEPEDRGPWLKQIDKWRRAYRLAFKQDPNGPIKPQFVIRKLYEATNGDAVIATEVGQNQMWTAQYYHFSAPRTLLSSGGLGTMGYGFPAAIGAQVAFPGRIVIDIAGDASFQMNIQELATAVQHKLPVKVAILNNSCLGMLRQWQEFFYEKRYSCTQKLGCPDFVKLAEAYGAVGLRASTPQEVLPVIKKALKIDKPVLMEFLVDPAENVYPMVPAGAPISEMLLV